MSKRTIAKHAAFSRIAAHLIETAPDSISAREQLLRDLIDVLPPNHKRIEMVRSSLRFLQFHQKTQMELPLELLAALKGAQS